jgi:hypothetical protein
MPIHTFSRLLKSRRFWIHGTVAGVLLGSVAQLAGQECAPPPDGLVRKRAAWLAPLGCAPCKKIRREPTREEIEAQAFSEELSAAISAAVAEAVAQQQAQAATANAGPGTTAAPAQFQAPAPSGQIAGASNSVGLRGLEIHFPELRFALPTLQLPSLVKFRREPHMHIDSASAPMIAPASALPAAAPAGYAPQAYAAGPYGYGSPYGYAPATTAPASAAPATAPAAAPATAAPARSAAATAGCRPKTRVRRVGPTKQRFWSDEEEWEVIQEVPAEDCAPDYEAEGGPASRAEGHVRAHRHSGEVYDPIPKAPAADAMAQPVEPSFMPPAPGASRAPSRGSDELQNARAELAAAQRQLAEVTKLLAAAGVDATAGGANAVRATSAGATAIPGGAARRSSKAQTVQRLFQELEAPAQQSEEEQAERVAEETTAAPTTTQTRRSPSAVRPAGHESSSPSTRPSPSASSPTRPAIRPATGAGPTRRGRASFGPGHALGR